VVFAERGSLRIAAGVASPRSEDAEADRDEENPAASVEPALQDRYIEYLTGRSLGPGITEATAVGPRKA